MPYSAANLEYSRCPLECGIGDDIVLVGNDRLHGLPGTFSVVRCRHCGLLRTNPRPSPAAMGAYYPDDYGPYLGTRVAAADGGKPDSSRRRRLLRKIIRFNTQALPSVPPGRLLEIGCASGGFLHKMAGRGWQVEGIEVSAQAAAAARSLGYPVHNGSVETAPEREGAFDLAVGWMVLEHLHDPVGALRKLHRWVRPGGWLALSVPDAAAVEFRFFKEDWFALQLPTHLYHYTPRTLGAMLDRSGWALQRVIPQRVLTNLVASLGYRLQSRGWMPGVGRFCEQLPNRGTAVNVALYPLAFVAAALRQTGRMTVWAQRRD